MDSSEHRQHCGFNGEISILKDTDSTVAKRGSVFIGLVTLMMQYGPGIKGLS